MPWFAHGDRAAFCTLRAAVFCFLSEQIYWYVYWYCARRLDGLEWEYPIKGMLTRPRKRYDSWLACFYDATALSVIFSLHWIYYCYQCQLITHHLMCLLKPSVLFHTSCPCLAIIEYKKNVEDGRKRRRRLQSSWLFISGRQLSASGTNDGVAGPGRVNCF